MVVKAGMNMCSRGQLGSTVLFMETNTRLLKPSLIFNSRFSNKFNNSCLPCHKVILQFKRIIISNLLSSSNFSLSREEIHMRLLLKPSLMVIKFSRLMIPGNFSQSNSNRRMGSTAVETTSLWAPLKFGKIILKRCQ